MSRGRTPRSFTEVIIDSCQKWVPTRSDALETVSEQQIWSSFATDKSQFSVLSTQMVATGICGTDIKSLADKELSQFCPIIMGHEGAGIVESVGEGVSTVKTGRKQHPASRKGEFRSPQQKTNSRASLMCVTMKQIKRKVKLCPLPGGDDQNGP